MDATPESEHVAFTNGKTLNIGQETGGIREDLWRVQIRNTVKKHLEKELQVKGKGIKVLTLFFIDKVANYRAYDEQGAAVKGKFALEFEAAFKELTAQERYKDLLPSPLESLHNGYSSPSKPKRRSLSGARNRKRFGSGWPSKASSHPKGRFCPSLIRKRRASTWALRPNTPRSPTTSLKSSNLTSWRSTSRETRTCARSGSTSASISTRSSRNS